MPEPIERDFEIIGPPNATVFLVCPQNDGAKEYLSDMVPADAQWLGQNLAVEHNYMQDFIGALFNDGFKITWDGALIVGRNQ